MVMGTQKLARRSRVKAIEWSHLAAQSGDSGLVQSAPVECDSPGDVLRTDTATIDLMSFPAIFATILARL